MKRGLVFIALLWSAAAACAQSSAGLPPPAAVMDALRESPRLQAQIEAIEHGVQQERKRRAGPHEWQIAATQQQRTEASGQRFDEQEYGLQRAMRWPWKASIDRRLGTQERLAGELTYSDAWHEAGRDLLDLWFEWLAAEQATRIADDQLRSLQDQQRSVERRVQAGDAAAVELQLAEAETRRMRSSRNELSIAALRAREALAREFPALPFVRRKKRHRSHWTVPTRGGWIRSPPITTSSSSPGPRRRPRSCRRNGCRPSAWRIRRSGCATATTSTAIADSSG